MRVPIGSKFILGTLSVVAIVVFAPGLVARLEYPQEWSLLLSVLVALTVGLLFGWFFSLRFSRNIGQLTAAAEAISQGDLTRGVSLPSASVRDETHDLAGSLSLMVQSLRELVGHVRGGSWRVTEASRNINASALEVSVASGEVASATEQIARGAEVQAQLVGKSSGIIKETAISIELVASRARETVRVARTTSATAQRGAELAGDSLELLKEFIERLEALGNRFEQFNSRLQRVGKVADFIGDVARQTNLLALNASIEAVRAGEYGKGFAVVADEVRKLSESTTQSAGEIAEMITALREESQRVHESIIDGSRAIRSGRKNVDVTAAAFAEIVASVQDTERRAASIADLSQMQLEGGGRMVQAVEEIARVTEQNAAAAVEVSAATEEQTAAMQELAQATRQLLQLASELEVAVQRFTVEEPIELVEEP